MCNLGFCYYYGRGVDVDKQKGFDYFMALANASCTKEAIKVADFYRYGDYVIKDEKKLL